MIFVRLILLVHIDLLKVTLLSFLGREEVV